MTAIRLEGEVGEGHILKMLLHTKSLFWLRLWFSWRDQVDI